MDKVPLLLAYFLYYWLSNYHSATMIKAEPPVVVGGYSQQAPNVNKSLTDDTNYSVILATKRLLKNDEASYEPVYRLNTKASLKVNVHQEKPESQFNDQNMKDRLKRINRFM